MILLPRTIRLDPSDTLIFPQAAEPGEWAVPGGFLFWDDTPETLAGKRQQAFRAGFLGLSSFGWATLVEVAEATEAEHDAAVAALAAEIRLRHGAPDDAAATEAALDEMRFARSLCDHPPGTVLALSRRHDEEGAVREQFRTLRAREGGAPDRTRLPVFGVVAVEEAEGVVERPDLAAMARIPR
ncbi:MAG TPA: DUF6505 family protein [Acetobacteraceae bacterium]|nr:DUF6505 family protein [Acetobacteraceae bacterium]